MNRASIYIDNANMFFAQQQMGWFSLKSVHGLCARAQALACNTQTKVWSTGFCSPDFSLPKHAKAWSPEPQSEYSELKKGPDIQVGALPAAEVTGLQITFLFYNNMNNLSIGTTLTKCNTELTLKKRHR